MFSNTDFVWMQRALTLAKRSIYTSTPNPRVGCVIIKDDKVIGEGFTQPAGFNHAEIQALKDALSRGHDVKGAIAYVTLEPCSHFGRTPPCASALIDAGIVKVITSMEDPDPRVSGRGIKILRDAGVNVCCGLLENEATELNIGFVSRMTRKKPWVRVKTAASLDGRTALPSGESQWITGKIARKDNQAWRARACAILTGIGTALRDDPKLTVRDIKTTRQPQRVLIDNRLELPLNAQLLQGDKIIIFCGNLDIYGKNRAAALCNHGVDVVSLPKDGKVDLLAMLGTLSDRGINELHVEAGYKLNGSLLQGNHVDELLIYIAPSLLGVDSACMFNFSSPSCLDERTHLKFHNIKKIGSDLRIIARVVSSTPTFINKI